MLSTILFDGFQYNTIKSLLTYSKYLCSSTLPERLIEPGGTTKLYKSFFILKFT